MNLGQRQEWFAFLLPRLIDKAHKLGFHVRCGDLFRDPRVHGFIGERGALWIRDMFKLLKIRKAPKELYGSKNSQHKNKCAIDLNLRHPTTGMVWGTKGHEELGEWWEKQHPYCRWGGRYNDGNHYEFLKWRDED